MMERVRHNDIMAVYEVIAKHTVDHSATAFWNFLGYKAEYDNGWHLPPASAQLIRALLGPHAKTIIKARLIVLGASCRS